MYINVNIEDIEQVQYFFIMRAFDEHNIILFNKCNKLSNKLTRI
jgi:hypothetical protein